MKRKEFLKTSAIVGASIAASSFLWAKSGMFSMNGSRKVYRILNADRTKVGTLPILRAFAGNHIDYVSPYVLFDEFGPVDIRPGSDALRVDAHPHAGIIPTTYFLSGSGHHRDSLDYDFQINTGEYMMFSSGRGAIHMEESGQQLKDKGGSLHGFQIWLNMPARYKYNDPSTIVYKGDTMPTLFKEKYTVRVVLGEFMGCESGIETLSPAFYYYIKLQPGARLDIPTHPAHNAFIYMVNGEVELEGQKALKPNQLALYQRGESMVNLFSANGAELFALGGQPLNEPVYSYGPFVMNDENQIRQCIADYQNGRMGDPNKVNN